VRDRFFGGPRAHASCCGDSIRPPGARRPDRFYQRDEYQLGVQLYLVLSSLGWLARSGFKDLLFSYSSVICLFLKWPANGSVWPATGAFLPKIPLFYSHHDLLYSSSGSGRPVSYFQDLLN